MPSASFKLTGFRELEKALLKLGPKVSKSVTNKAMTAARKPVIKAIRTEAPVDDGDLKKAVGHKTITYKRRKIKTNIIGARSRWINRDGRKKNPALYAHLVEFGTVPHSVGDGKVMTIGDRLITGPVDHPGSKPDPFMRRGWGKSKRTALARFLKSYRSGVAREARKARGTTK